jgi:2-polyprenyl-6-methoxyphenol hydroxylase-like FAD-dependent oxidoreductase
VAARRAAIVGGGIGGLATAIALTGRGWQVRLFERAPAFTEVGAGISLWANAMRALDAIGVGARLAELGLEELTGGLRYRTGRWLSRPDGAEMARRYGPVTILHRADLLNALCNAVPAGVLSPGDAVDSVAQTASSVTVGHGGDTYEADLLVAADGLRSTVRPLVWPNAAGPRYAGYTAWRTVTPRPEGCDTGGETWGDGTRFGFAVVPGDRMYWYATANAPEGATSPDGELAELARRFGSWHEPIPSLLAAASAVPVLRHDIYELSDQDTFVSGRVALLGDAAHAMTPNLGQGACQALEDAATLAAVLDREPSISDALARYDRLRRPRTQAIVRRSRQMGTIGQWASRPAVIARNLLMPLIPSSLAIRSVASVVNWPPPEGIG